MKGRLQIKNVHQRKTIITGISEFIWTTSIGVDFIPLYLKWLELQMFTNCFYYNNSHCHRQGLTFIKCQFTFNWQKHLPPAKVWKHQFNNMERFEKLDVYCWIVNAVDSLFSVARWIRARVLTTSCKQYQRAVKITNTHIRSLLMDTWYIWIIFAAILMIHVRASFCMLTIESLDHVSTYPNQIKNRYFVSNLIQYLIRINMWKW